MDDNHASVSRTRVFVLLDGVFVVKWGDNQVQELLTGQYRQFERRDFGAPITDFELNQLRQAGIVESFDKEVIQLSPSLERSQFYQMHAQQRRVRSYYLNTTLPGRQLSLVEDCLLRLGMDEELQARNRDDFVVIWSAQGHSFASFDAAEEIRTFVAQQMPDIFGGTVVAFVETTRRE